MIVCFYIVRFELIKHRIILYPGLEWLRLADVSHAIVVVCKQYPYLQSIPNFLDTPRLDPLTCCGPASLCWQRTLSGQSWDAINVSTRFQMNNSVHESSGGNMENVFTLGNGPCRYESCLWRILILTSTQILARSELFDATYIRKI